MTRIIAISRPRFWLYVFGPYIVGLAAGATSSADFLRIGSILFGRYFPYKPSIPYAPLD